MTQDDYFTQGHTHYGPYYFQFFSLLLPPWGS